METFITGNVMGLSPALGGIADINRHIVFPKREATWCLIDISLQNSDWPLRSLKKMAAIFFLFFFFHPSAFLSLLSFFLSSTSFCTFTPGKIHS
jgi:hypothetical protein